MVFAERCGTHRFATLAGFAGIGLIVAGAFGSGARPGAPAPASWSNVLLYLGIGVLLAAWVRLGHLVRTGSASAVDIRRAVWLWAVPLLVAPPLFSNDLYTYLAQGAVAQAGLDPYTHVPAELSGALIENAGGHWLSVPSPYGPLFILVVKSALGLTGGNPLFSALLTRLVMVAGLWLLCRAIPVLCRHLGGAPAGALWIVAANPLVLLHLVSGGHNDLLMIGLLAAGVGLVLDRAAVRGFALVAMAVAVKATAGVALPFLVWVWVAQRSGSGPTWREFLRAVVLSVSTVVVSFGLISGLAGVSLGWIKALDGNSVLEPLLSVPTALGKIAALLVPGFDSGQLVPGFRTAAWFVLAGVVAWLWWRSRRSAVTAVRGAAAALLATVLCLPVVLPWYYSWPLALGAAVRWRVTWIAFAAGFSAFLVVSSQTDGSTPLPLWGYMAGFVFSIAVAAGTRLRKRTCLPGDRAGRLSVLRMYTVLAPGWGSPVQRADLRDALKAALKNRDRAAIGALRSALAAMGGVAAVPVAGGSVAEGGRVAGAAGGLGVGEAQRGELSDAGVRSVGSTVSVVENEGRERAANVEGCGRRPRPEQAGRLCAGAAVPLRRVELVD
ncbi:alpha-1,6-mannosyltransferase [Amycolatopsis sulphurea]|uniref:Alpha-1,6-mannosyltransferase n=1 Tax=Amycolatopsis sulphurea TaxID=76022 RepID=A0A2A9F6V0_9PSEU|nr:polyprenol phosphomannose-dependent alpha 1,6 mannosyltransferase MptB [Amycolatopsis sulphurea]PFG46898.1 alpha-1,6-mannosyltransferase [Amycolatopsis sulphurea]